MKKLFVLLFLCAMATQLRTHFAREVACALIFQARAFNNNIHNQCRLLCDDDYRTPLMRACWSGNAQEVTRLINTGVDVDLSSTWRTRPLSIAVSEQRVDIVKILLTAGAHVNWNLMYQAMMPDREDPRYQIKTINIDKEVEVLRIVLQHAKTDMHVVDVNRAFRKALCNEKFEPKAIRACIESGKITVTAWEKAVLLGNAQEVQSLIDQGQNVNAEIENQTSLERCVRYGHAEAAQVLLAAQADTIAHYGYSLLGIAAHKGHARIIEVLVQAGMVIDGIPGVGDALVETGIFTDVDEYGSQHWTPLMIASLHRKTDVVKTLLALGADAHRKDNEGKTALDIANSSYGKNNFEIIAMLSAASGTSNLGK